MDAQRKPSMSQTGQSEKNSVRVYVFRFALKLRHARRRWHFAFVPQADVRRVNAALAFLVRNRSQTAPLGYEDLFPVQRSPRFRLQDGVIEWSTVISSCSSPAPETALACADAEHHDRR